MKKIDKKHMKKIDKKQEDPTFIVTDNCMWENNKLSGRYHPHAIELVDIETGQVRYLKSGARIKVVEGDITENRDQESYNKFTSLNEKVMIQKS